VDGHSCVGGVLAVVDGQIDTPKIREMQPDRPIDSLLNPDAMAETYWSLHTQDKTAWSHEQEMRPYVEKW